MPVPESIEAAGEAAGEAPGEAPVPRTALVTLGRLPVALDVVRALRLAGWRVLVADPLPVHLCRLSRDLAGHRRVRAPARDPDGYLDDLLRIVERDRVSLVVPVSEETPHVARLQGRCAARVLCSEHGTVLELHDKLRFAALCERIGVAVPPSVRAHASDALCRAGDWVQKPRLSCSGTGVRFGLAGQQAALQPGTLVQRRIRGEALCTFAMAIEGRVVVQSGYRDLLASGSVSVRFEAVDLPPPVSELVRRIVAATAFTGMIAFDVLHDAQRGWMPIECNPRATSGIHLLEPAVLGAAFARLGAVPGGGADALDGQEPAAGSTQGAGLRRMGGLAALPAGTRRQAFWSALLDLQGGLFRARFDRGEWRDLIRVRDILWQARDPLPFLLMTPGSAPLLWRALRRGRSIAEVATRDVGWYEEPASPP